MDRLELSRKMKDLFGKYKYVLLILAVGILLMSLPEEQAQRETTQASAAAVPAT